LICQATASPAPAQDVARRILGKDVTQIEVFTERVKRLLDKVHLQRHHPLREGHLRPCRRGGAERRRARRDAATVPPAPRCLPNAARRGGGLFAHAKACGFGHRSRHRTPISGSIKVRVLTRAKGRCECCGAGCCLANPAPTGPGGGPHRAHEPGRHRRPQQPAGTLLPLQRRHTQRPRPSISSSIEQPSWQATSLRICRKVPTLRGLWAGMVRCCC
jgi:hypothetical protein